MTQDKVKDDSPHDFNKPLDSTLPYYSLLELTPTATLDEVRRAYRLKSKLYHPDTTGLPADTALQKFRELNEAYAVLSNPERRQRYDAQAGKTSHGPSVDGLSRSGLKVNVPTTAYLDPKERPLSPGEILALLILGVTFLVCLALAVILGVARGEMVIQTAALHPHPLESKPVLSRPMPQKRRIFDLASPKSATIEQQAINRDRKPKA